MKDSRFDYKSLIDRSHQIAVDKGFWEQGTKRNSNEMLMLVVSELGEALEAHRKGKYSMKLDDKTDVIKSVFEFNGRSGLNTELFETAFKDTVEDELADAYIRIFDFIAGWNIEFKEEHVDFIADFMSVDDPENFGSALLSVTKSIVEAAVWHGKSITAGQNIMYAIGKLNHLVDKYGYDIDTAIELKMHYNANRPYKHNKKY